MIDIAELRQNDWVFYPNRGLDPLNTAYNLVGRIHEVNIEQGYVSVVDDGNSPTNQTGANHYRSDDIDPIYITEDILLYKFGFEKKYNARLYGLMDETFFEKNIEGIILQVIKSSNTYCVVTPSEGFFGCCFTPIVYVHKLQNLIAEKTGIEVEVLDIME